MPSKKDPKLAFYDHQAARQEEPPIVCGTCGRDWISTAWITSDKFVVGCTEWDCPIRTALKSFPLSDVHPKLGVV